MEGTREDRGSCFNQRQPFICKEEVYCKRSLLREVGLSSLHLVYSATGKSAPVSGPLLQEKALQMFKILYPDKDADLFKGSSGWLHKFPCRHGVRGISLQGESLSADVSAVFTFRSKLLRKMEEEEYT